MIPLSVTVVIAALAADPQAKGPPAPTSRQVRQAVERGLAFLEKDAAKWRKEHTCATCHHGAMTVWAFNEAKGRGLLVRLETLADLAGWGIAEDPVHINDFHATLLHLFGLDHLKLTYRFQAR